MAITGFGRGRDDMAPPTSSPPTTSSSTAGGLTAFIDQGSEFEGKLSFRDTVRIDGRFSGEITSENTLIVGESGEIEADIRSNTVVVSGVVHGDVIAGCKVVLHKTARVEGNIETPTLVIEEGAAVNGHLKMGTITKNAGNLKAIEGGGKAKEAPKDVKDAPRGPDGAKS